MIASLASFVGKLYILKEGYPVFNSGHAVQYSILNTGVRI